LGFVSPSLITFTMFYRFYSRKRKQKAKRMMIYSQAFRNEQHSPAVALFNAAGLIKTCAGLPPEEIRKNLKSKWTWGLIREAETCARQYFIGGVFVSFGLDFLGCCHFIMQ
jgi:hypothetical protein